MGLVKLNYTHGEFPELQVVSIAIIICVLTKKIRFCHYGGFKSVFSYNENTEISSKILRTKKVTSTSPVLVIVLENTKVSLLVIVPLSDDFLYKEVLFGTKNLSL